MRILGENNEGFIVSLSKVEIANIFGLYSEFSDGFKTKLKQAEGEDIPISTIYQHYFAVKNILNAPEYDKAISKLKDMQQVLTSIDPLIQIIKKNYEAD